MVKSYQVLDSQYNTKKIQKLQNNKILSIILQNIFKKKFYLSFKYEFLIFITALKSVHRKKKETFDCL